MAYILFDLVILAILALFLWRGMSKGLVLSLCGLVAVLVAFVGSTLLANLLAPKVGQALEPKFTQLIEEQLEGSLQGAHSAQAAPEEVPLSGVLDALRDMGLYKDLIDNLDKAVRDGMADAAASAAAQVAAAMAQSVAYMVIFLVGFLLLLLLWAILSRTLNLVTKLPGLNALNKTGGALIGLLKGVILLFIAAWALRLSGKVIPEDAVQQTYLLHFFMTTNPVTLITGI